MPSSAQQRCNNATTQTNTKTSPTKNYTLFLTEEKSLTSEAVNEYEKKRDINRREALETLQTVLPERIIKFIYT